MKISNASQNSGSKKAHFVCNDEITFVIHHNLLSNVELKVESDKNNRKNSHKKK